MNVLVFELIALVGIRRHNFSLKNKYYHELPAPIPLAPHRVADLLQHLHDGCVKHGHLKFKNKPIFMVILASWGIAFFEYLLQVPANRWGNSVYTAPQLKIIQEVITLTVFAVFAVYNLDVKIRWNHLAAFVCILAAVAFTFLPKPPGN